MKVLVTGGAGFLGSHVADRLSESGHDVIVFDAVRSEWLREDQRMIVGDILDRDLIAKTVAGVDAVYHFAAVADIEEAMNNPVRTIEVNVMGTLGLLEAARNAKLQRFVFASSIYVYSHQGSFYRTSKQACERLIEDYNNHFGLPYTILRFGSLYGPRAGQTNAVHRMVTEALTNRTITYAGTGAEVREYIHVLDGACAAADILAPEFTNEIVHLTGHERMTTQTMMETIAEIVGGNIDVVLGKGQRPGHYVHTPYSYTPKLGRKLVRKSYIDIGLGLLELIDHQSQGAAAEQ